MGTLKALKCVRSDYDWWLVGKVYDVNSLGFIYDENDSAREADEMVQNCSGNLVPRLDFEPIYHEEGLPSNVSDGFTASYYELPRNSTELQHLISHKNMNAQLGEIFRECYRYGTASHCDELRGIKKILFYANAELERLEKLNEDN